MYTSKDYTYNTINDLTNLNTLNLGENSLQTIPETISDLTNLETLMLQRNELTSLPEEIIKLIQLKELWIIGNLFQIKVSKNPLNKIKDQFSSINPLMTKKYYLSFEIEQWLKILEKNGCNIDGVNPKI